MKFVTFNIRCDTERDGVNRFLYRKGLILDRIDSEKPDIIGFQEMTHPMNAYMREKLAYLGYTLVGGGRAADYRGEHNPIAFRTDRYELLGLETSWLSDTPFVPGSRYEIQSDCPRILTHALLRPAEEGDPFHVYNTHLDHRSSPARMQGAARVLSEIVRNDEMRHHPVILCGDMNAVPDADEITVFRAHPFGLREVTGGIGTTWHDWGRGNYPQIDYIFVKGFKPSGDVVLWKEDLNGIYLSDHYPVCIDLELE